MWSHKQNSLWMEKDRVHLLFHRQISEEHQILEKPSGYKIK